MIVVTERLESSIQREFEQFAELGVFEDQEISWLLLVARALSSSLREIEEKGLLYTRDNVSADLTYARGRLNALRTTLNLRRNNARPVECLYRSKRPSKLEHHLLSAAAFNALFFGVLDSNDKKTAAKWARLGWSRKLLASELEESIRRLNRKQYSGPRAYYSTAMLYARLMLARAGLVLDTEEVVKAEALILNSSTLFEKYIRLILQKALIPEGLSVEKAFVPSLSLFTDGVGRLAPDIVVRDQHEYKFIADVKYKFSDIVDIADYYQIVEYARAYSVKNALLVLLTERADGQSITRRSTYDGINVFEARCYLGDPFAAESWLTDTVKTSIKA